jgi:hypothetical protein
MPSPSYPFIGVSFVILLLSPFPFSFITFEEQGPLLAFDDLIVTRFIEFFNDVMASGGEAVSESCCVELSDDIDDDESERSEPAECTSSE